MIGWSVFNTILVLLNMWCVIMHLPEGSYIIYLNLALVALMSGWIGFTIGDSQ
jgi:uncharacterized membrane protein